MLVDERSGSRLPKRNPKGTTIFLENPIELCDTHLISISSVPALIYAFILSFQAFKQKVSARNFVLTNAKKVSLF